MALKYKVVSKKPRGMAGEKPPRYYPALTGRHAIDLDEVCDRISQRSTINGADVVGVVRSFIELIPELLLNGHNVKLDGFGTFSLHASGTGKDTPEEVSAKDITGLKMAFLPDKRIKRELGNAKFEKYRGNNS